MMDARISRAVSAGSVSSTDQSAFAKALDSIDSSLSSSSSGASSTRTDMKTRIDSLISDQVTAGTLTDDQAQELEGFFAQGPGGPPPGGSVGDTQSADAASATAGMGGPDGMRGPPPPPPPADESSSSDTSSATASTASAGGSSQLDALISFLTALRSSMASGNTYGSSTSGTSNSGVLIDAAA